MQFYPEGQIIEITVPFTKDGARYAPTDVSIAIYDGEDEVIMAPGPIAFDSGSEAVVVQVPAAVNNLQGEDLQEIRRLEAVVTHDAGVFVVSHFWGIEHEQRLQTLKNSFMSYETALMEARGFTNLTSFGAETKDRQIAALSEAFRRITDLSLIYEVANDAGRIERRDYLNAVTWPSVTREMFLAFPTHFRRALRAAQLAEADELLQGNVIARKHAQGIVSETIGESSVTLRAGFSGQGSSTVGTTALALLSGYIDNTVKIGRA